MSIGIKTSATASSYVFLQQELARGLRLSQPSRVAKDAAWRALGFAIKQPLASSKALPHGRRRRALRSSRAHETPPAATAARRLTRERTPSPENSHTHARPPAETEARTTTWADPPEKAEAKDAADAAASAAVEMAAGAAGAAAAGAAVAATS